MEKNLFNNKYTFEFKFEKNKIDPDEQINNSTVAVKILKYVFLIGLVFIYVLPLLWIFMVSLKTKPELMSDPFGWPKKLNWDNFSIAWNKGHLDQAMFNSAWVCIFSLIVSLFIGCLAAFAIARMKFKYATKIMLLYFMIGMMVPIHCVIAPLFKTFKTFGLLNSLWGLTLPYITFSLPMTIFIMTNFFKGMSTELFESACIDGCNIYQCFWNIGFPLARNGLFVTGLMAFIANWNELLMALVFISDNAKNTLPVRLTAFAGPHSTNYTHEFAAIVVAILPTIIVYCIFSNKIVDGLTQGAVKG